LTGANVFFHPGPKTRINVSFKIVRNLPPDLFAVDCHGLVPQYKGNFVLRRTLGPSESLAEEFVSAVPANRTSDVPAVAKLREHTETTFQMADDLWLLLTSK